MTFNIARRSLLPNCRTTSRAAISVRFLSTPVPDSKIHNVTVFGAGLMGAGIAQVSAQAGFNVTLCDVTPAALTNGRSIITSSLNRLASKRNDSMQKGEDWVNYVNGRIKETTDSQKAVEESDLVIEAIVESLPVKQKLFATIDQFAPNHTILASNTSSLSLSSIASQLPQDRQELFAGLHFFNPVPAMKLVELSATSSTSEATMSSLVEVVKKMDKRGVICKDTPGFIVNRLLVPYMLEAIRMLERGEATKEDIDDAMKLGAGYPMGPLALSDFVGLDTLLHISSGWRNSESSDNDKTGLAALVKPTPLLEQMVNNGKLGRKSGQGFYEYPKKTK